MYTSFDIDLLLYAQRGLLGEIPFGLRTVSFDLSIDGRDFSARFEFDGEPSEEARECVSVAMTNIIANYSANHSSYNEEIVSVPFPQVLKPLRLIAFLRNEEEWNP